MRKISFIILLLLFYVTALQAQTYSIVEKAETEVLFNSHKDLVCKERRVVTVLNEKGREAANFYNSYNERISALGKFSGFVTNAAGKVIHKIKKSDLQRSEYSTELASDVFRYYYEYTPVQYPFTVTYEWEEKCSDGLIGLPVFVPQQGYNQEVKQATYRLIASASLPCRYKVINHSAEVTCKNREDGKQLYEVSFNNLSAIPQEPYAPDIGDLLPRVYFVPETFSFEKTTGEMKSWQTYGSWLYSLLQGRSELPPTLVEKLKELTAACSNDKERVQAVYDYLAATTRYVSIQLGIGGLQPMTASSVHRTGFGDCKALVNYTRAMLATLGIDAYNAVISTENERLFPDFASANQTNHVVLQVPLPQDTLWLECTAPTLPMGYIHHSIAGHDALLLKAEGGVLHRLPTYADSLNTQTNHARILLSPEGTATLSVHRNSRLFQYEEMKGFEKQPLNKQKDFLRADINLIQAEVEDIRYEEHKSAYPSADVFYTVASNKYGTQTGKRIFLPLNVLHRNFSTPKENGERINDVIVRYGYLDTDSIEIQLPDEYEIEAVPQTEEVETPFGSFRSSFHYQAGTLQIVHRLYVKSGRYLKEEYAQFLDFHRIVSRQYGAKVIIKKKE